MLTSILYQGYTIAAPDGPADQGTLTTHPSPVQIISQVDTQFVYNKPLTPEIALGREASNELVPGTLTLQCYWDTVFNVVAQDTQVTQSVTYTTGVTTTDADTQTFAMTFGVTADLLPGISAALSATFTQSETHSVAVSESRSITQSYAAVAGTTLQVWQLHADYIAEFEKDGTSYRYVLSVAGSAENGLILAMTFPETAAQATAATADTSDQGTVAQGTAASDPTASDPTAPDAVASDPVASDPAA